MVLVKKIKHKMRRALTWRENLNTDSVVGHSMNVRQKQDGYKQEKDGDSQTESLVPMRCISECDKHISDVPPVVVT